MRLTWSCWIKGTWLNLLNEHRRGHPYRNSFRRVNCPKELPDSGMGTQNMERLQKLTERPVHLRSPEHCIATCLIVFACFRSAGILHIRIGLAHRHPSCRIEKAEEDFGNQATARGCCFLKTWAMLEGLAWYFKMLCSGDFLSCWA